VGAGFLSVLWDQVSTRLNRPLRALQQGFRRVLASGKQFPQVLRQDLSCKEENAGKAKTTIFPAEKKEDR
jgi:hypothetical protein